MIKNFLFATFIISPLLASAQSADTVVAGGGMLETAVMPPPPTDSIPLAKCNGDNWRTCEYLPEHHEVPLVAAKKKVSRGTLIITSTPREATTPNGLNIEVKISIQCKDSKTEHMVVSKMSICSYPLVKALVNTESQIFKVTHDPLLNITQDGHNIVLRYLSAGTDEDDYCGPEAAPKSVPNPCLPAATKNP